MKKWKIAKKIMIWMLTAAMLLNGVGNLFITETAQASQEEENMTFMEEPPEESTEHEVLPLANESVSYTDYTTNTDEITVSFSDLSVIDGNQNPLTMNSKTENNVIQYDLTGNSIYDVKQVSFTLNIKINKNPEERQLKSGDIFKWEIPKGLTLPENLSHDGEIKFFGILIAKYHYDTEEGNLIITFQDSVNGSAGYTDINLGMNIKMDIDTASIQGNDRIIHIMPSRNNAEPAVDLKLPQDPTEVSGIKKEGVLDTATNTITWTIQVGTDAISKGAALNGLRLAEEFGNDQTIVSATIDGGTIGISNNQESSSILTLQGENLKAPATVTVQTAIKRSVLDNPDKEKEYLNIKNSVSMLPPMDDSISIGEHDSDEDEVDVKLKPNIQKNGIQIDSDTIQWTITVNAVEKENSKEHPLTIHRGIIIDKLASGLTYEKGSLRYKIGDGAWGNLTDYGNASEPSASETWTGNSIYVKTEISESGSHEILRFYMEETIDTTYTIVFNTKVGDDFTSSNGDGTAEIENTAMLHANLPYTEGGVNYYSKENDTKITTTFADTKIYKSVSKIQDTNRLIWVLNPSTRVEEYEEAVITDWIENNQKYLADTLKIVHKNDNGANTSDLLDKEIFIHTCDDKGEKYTVTLKFDPAKAKANGYSKELSDYTMEYQTSAMQNGEAYYRNTAKITVTTEHSKTEDTATAGTYLKNDWIGKETSLEYDENGIPYFHYTITLNGSALKNLKNVEVIDDISKAIRIIDGDNDDSTDVISTNWTIDRFRTKIYLIEDGKEKEEIKDNNILSIVYETADETGKDHIFKCRFSELSAKAEIHLYVKYDGSKEQLTTGEYKNKVMYSTNTASAKSDEVYSLEKDSEGYVSVNSKTKGWGHDFNNTLVAKNPTGVKNDNGTKITWSVVINPNSGKMGPIVLHDTLAKSQKYMEDTVKIYKAGYENGTKNLIKKEEFASDKVEISFDVSVDERIMNIKLDAQNEPVILEYETGLLDNGLSEVCNTISVWDDENTYGTTTGRKELSGNSWGSLASVGNLKIVKVDKSINAELPLAGAKFTIYKDAEAKYPVDTGITKEDGTLVFMGLDVKVGDDYQTYYYRETEAPEGYVKDDTLYPINISRGNKNEIKIGNVRESTTDGNSASIVNIQKLFYYAERSENDIFTEKSASGQTAQFEVVFYPYGKNTDEERIVSFIETEAGVYTYSGDTSETNAVDVIKNASDGNIRILNLPWGYYGIREIQTEDGFIRDAEEKNFSIILQKDTGTMTTAYEFGTNTEKNNGVIENRSTVFYVEKYKESNQEPIIGSHFSIHKKDMDGRRGEVVKDRLNGNIPYDWITSDEKKGIYNLPVGTYLLHDYCKPEDDLEFVVEENGKISIDGVEVSDSHIKIEDNSVSVEIVKYTAWDSEQEKDFEQEEDYIPFPKVSFVIEGNLASGKTKETFVTDAEGKIVLDGKLIDGETYTLREETPYGYESLETDTVFIYHADPDSLYPGIELKTDAYDSANVKTEFEHQVSTLKIFNHSKQNTNISFVISDEKTGAGISGMVFAITVMPEEGKDIVLLSLVYAESGKAGDIVTYEIAGKQYTHVLKEGEIFVPDLGKGTYVFTLESVPEGYKYTGAPMSFSVKIENDLKNTFIEINQEAISSGKINFEILSGSSSTNGLFTFKPAESEDIDDEPEAPDNEPEAPDNDPEEPDDDPEDTNGDSGDTDGDSGNTDGDSGNTDGDSGDTDGDSGNTDDDSEDTDGDSGNTDGDSEDTDGDSGNTGDDSGNTEDDSKEPSKDNQDGLLKEDTALYPQRSDVSRLPETGREERILYLGFGGVFIILGLALYVLANVRYRKRNHKLK